MLLLYYYTGRQLSEKIKQENWSTKVIKNIAVDLQKGLPGLRGFSYTNLRNMRSFFEEYFHLNILLLHPDNEENTICQSVTGKLENRQETIDSIRLLITAPLGEVCNFVAL